LHLKRDSTKKGQLRERCREARPVTAPGLFAKARFQPFQPAAEKSPVNFLLFTGSLIFTLAMVALPARNLSVVMPRFMRGIQ
jgi:hypothetical protein